LSGYAAYIRLNKEGEKRPGSRDDSPGFSIH
jgi:hypothetical protein